MRYPHVQLSHSSCLCWRLKPFPKSISRGRAAILYGFKRAHEHVFPLPQLLNHSDGDLLSRIGFKTFLQELWQQKMHVRTADKTFKRWLELSWVCSHWSLSHWKATTCGWVKTPCLQRNSGCSEPLFPPFPLVLQEENPQFPSWA